MTFLGGILKQRKQGRFITLRAAHFSLSHDVLLGELLSSLHDYFHISLFSLAWDSVRSLLYIYSEEWINF